MRAALAAVPDVTITWQGVGYRLTADPDTIDLHRFQRLVARAHDIGADARSAALLEQALQLWRGEPFTGLNSPWLTTCRATLTHQRRAAGLDLTDIQLRQGKHAELLPGLADRVRQHPLDERLAGQFMLALYRSGQSTDALRHYRQLRQRLADELGTDPSPPLRHTHQQIRTADPALAARVPVPHQLPPPPRPFTGRATELAHLTEAVDEPGDTMPVSVIAGAGGIGKTWLVLHWAHQHLDRFPDGQLHMNLRGFDPAGEPMPPAMAVRGFLDALGVEHATIPPELDAQIGLYRSLLDGKRVLVVLDNARDTAQVTPLLPGSPTCAVLVTSRHRLDGLITAHGARSLGLDILTDTDARELLTRHIGDDRAAPEPDAVTRLLACCAGLPLALSIVAARARGQPQLPLATLAAELHDHASRLDALDAGTSADLRAVLSWSYHALSPDTGAAFGLLGLAPGTDIGVPATASLLALPIADARLVLRELEHGHLVRQHAPGRYHMHDLVRLYAADRAHHDHAEESRGPAVRRVVDFYLHTAFAGDRLLQPLLPPIKLGVPAIGCRPHWLGDQTAALAWFIAEQANLLAAQHLAAARGWAASVYQLAWVLTTFLYRQGHFAAALVAWQAGLAATTQLNDPVSQAGAHQLLGAISTDLGRHAEALRHLTLAEDVGGLREQAHLHHTLGWHWSQRGDNRRALEHASQALRRYRTLDMPEGETRQLTVTSWYHAQLGDYERARACCARALATARRHRCREDEALALGILAYIAQQTGHHTTAGDRYRQSHTLLHEVGSTYFEATVLDVLGQTHAALGEPEPAYRAWKQALRLCQDQRRTADADRIKQQLDTLPISSSPRR